MISSALGKEASDPNGRSIQRSASTGSSKSTHISINQLTVNMAYDNGAPRQMMDVTSLNLTCATCGKPITELPFMPQMNPDGTPARPVYCKEHKPQRKDFSPRGRF